MRALAALAGLPLLAGCVYFNTLYNSRDAWDRGERARLSGDEVAAQAAYHEAAERAGRAFRKDPEGRWADEALFTLGRSWLHLGRWNDAREALLAALEISDDEEMSRAAQVYLGATFAIAGDSEQAVTILNGALSGDLDDRSRAEGHMWRARVHLRSGQVDAGWWDLDRAAEANPALTIPAHLERVRWGIASGDSARTVSGAHALQLDLRGSVWADSLMVLVEGAKPPWGPAAAAYLLAPARTTDWPPAARNRLLFLRTDLLLEANDTLAAESELGWIAAGAGEGAVSARLSLADIRLQRARTPADLESVRRVLLPGVGDERVLTMLQQLREAEILSVWAVQSEPGAYFAAAELARDQLGAPGLARGLFLAMAQAEPDGPWAGKALLAALSLSSDPERVAGLVQLLEARPNDPYVQASRNGYLEANGLDEAEALLAEITAELRDRARDEAERRDVLIRSRSGGSDPND